MRIWIINHYASPPSHPGGTRHYNFAKELQKRGHEVTIIGANYNHFTHDVMVPLEALNQFDMRYEVPFFWIDVPAYKGNTINRFMNMVIFCWKLINNKILNSAPKPDVVIGSSPHLFAALGAQLLAKRLKKPFILEIRDLWPESLVDLGRFTNKHLLIKGLRQIEQYLYKRATRIICLLSNADQYLIQCGVNKNAIFWLPNSVDLQAIPHLPKITNEKFIVMYAGAHGVANDLDTVIAAGKILQDRGLSEKIKIILIGDGPEKNRLKKVVENLGIIMVEFLEAVPKEKIYFTLNQADAYIMLLKDSPVFRWGISPNKLFDYLSLERPVIFAVNTPFNPIQQSNAGISISPGNPLELAEAVIKLSELSKDELNRMGKSGKEYVLQTHHLIKLIDSLENLIQTVYCEYMESSIAN